MAEENSQVAKRTNHTWTTEEDKVLVECLLQTGLSWKGDNGFRPGFPAHIEKLIHSKIPGCSLKANPHIMSRIKLLKKHYTAICEMKQGLVGSGFGWNDKDKMIEVDREIYLDWIKSHPNAKGLYKKPFPYFDELGSIFGKDGATGYSAEGMEDAVQHMDREPVQIPESGTDLDDVYDTLGDNTTTPVWEPPLPDTATEEAIPHYTGSTSVSKRGKKRNKSEDGIGNSIQLALQDLNQNYQNSNYNIGRLVTCFEREGNGEDRRMNVLNELKNIEGLSAGQRVKVAMMMAKDSNITDIFWQGDYQDRVLVVSSLLEKYH